MSMDNGFRTRWFSAEMLVAHRFSAEGYVPSFPLVACPYDLVIDTGSRLLRVQTKCASLQRARIRKKGRGDRAFYRLKLFRKVRKAQRRVPTSKESFDVLCMVCEPDQIFVIPATAITSPINPECFITQLRVKPIALAPDRVDSKGAGEKWESYRNNFKLD